MLDLDEATIVCSQLEERINRCLLLHSKKWTSDTVKCLEADGNTHDLLMNFVTKPDDSFVLRVRAISFMVGVMEATLEGRDLPGQNIRMEMINTLASKMVKVDYLLQQAQKRYDVMKQSQQAIVRRNNLLSKNLSSSPLM